MRNFKKISLISLAVLSLTVLAVGGIKRFSENSILFGLGNTVRSLVFDYGNDPSAAKISVDPLSPEFVFNKKISGNELDMSGDINITGTSNLLGNADVSGKFRALGTSNGSRPCPVMTLAQRDLLTPAEGDCVYNSDDQTYNLYDGTQWNLIAGSGSGDLFTYYSEDFERNNASNFSISGASVVSNQTVNPLFNDQSIQIRHTPTDLNDTILYDVSIPVQQGQKEVFNYMSIAVNSPTVDSDAVYRLKVIESNDDITYNDIEDYVLDFSASSQTEIITLPFKFTSTSGFLKFKIEVIQPTTQVQEDLIIDNVQFTTNGMKSIIFDNITDIVQYAPVLESGNNPVTLNPTGAVPINGSWARVGDRMKVYFSFRNGSGGPATGTAGSIRITLPVGYEVDFNKLADTVGGLNNIGQAEFFGPEDRLIVGVVDATKVRLTKGDGGIFDISDIGASDLVTGNFEVPIKGWDAKGSGVVTEGYVQSQQTAVRLGGTSQTLSAGVTTSIVWNATLEDNKSLFDGTSSVTIKENGYYDLYTQIYTSTVNWSNNSAITASINVNGVSIGEGVNRLNATSSVGEGVQASAMGVYLKEGDVITVTSFCSEVAPLNSSSRYTYFNISKSPNIENVSVIVPSEKSDAKAMFYGSNNLQTVNNSDAIIYNTKIFDTLGGYNNSTGIFTAPENGIYEFKGTFTTNALSASSGIVALNIRDITGGLSYVGNRDAAFNTNPRNYVGLASITLKMEAGDEVEFRFVENVPSVTLNGSVGNNYMSITKLDSVNDTVIANKPLLTPLVSGQVVDTLETFKGKRVKKFTYQLPSAVSSTTSLINIGTNLELVNFDRISTDQYIRIYYADPSGVAYYRYFRSSGNLELFVSGGAGGLAEGSVVEVKYIE